MPVNTLPLVVTSDDAERFWKLVDIRDENDCWMWKGFIDRDGYGFFTVPSGGRRVKTGPHKGDFKWLNVRANRVAFCIQRGDPGSAWILHTCDMPTCVNPAHLYAGNAKNNAEDRDRKRRSGWITKPENIKRGHAAGRSKLTEEQVYEILNAFYGGRETVMQLKRRFGVDHKSIRLIVQRVNWKHLQFTIPT